MDDSVLDPAKVTEDQFRVGKENLGLTMARGNIGENELSITPVSDNEPTKSSTGVSQDKKEPEVEKVEEKKSVDSSNELKKFSKKVDGLKGYVKRMVNQQNKDIESLRGELGFLKKINDSLDEGVDLNSLLSSLSGEGSIREELDSINGRVDQIQTAVEELPGSILSQIPEGAPAVENNSTDAEETSPDSEESGENISLSENFEFDVTFSWYDVEDEEVKVTIPFNLHLPLPFIDEDSSDADILVLGYRESDYPENTRDLTRTLDHLKDNDLDYSIVVGSNTEQSYGYSSCSTVTNFFKCGYIEGGMVLFAILGSRPDETSSSEAGVYSDDVGIV